MTDEPIEVIEARADALYAAQEQLLESLVDLRRSRQISQETVAIRMGVSQPTVSAFERYDANPTLSTIRRYALAVGARLNLEVIPDYEGEAKAARADEPKPLDVVALDSPWFVFDVKATTTVPMSHWAEVARVRTDAGSNWSAALK